MHQNFSHMRFLSKITGLPQWSLDSSGLCICYNVFNMFYSAMKVGKGVWGLDSRKMLTIAFSTMLQSIIFDIEKTIARYQIIKILHYRRARGGKIVELGNTAPHATLDFVAALVSNLCNYLEVGAPSSNFPLNYFLIS